MIFVNKVRVKTDVEKIYIHTAVTETVDECIVENALSEFFYQRHAQYLKEHKNITYHTLMIERKLNSYLVEIDRQASEMYDRLIRQMAEREGVTEKLKAEQPMKWVGLTENIQARAREVVNNDLIFA